MRLYRIEDTRGLITDWWADDIEHAIEQWRDDENDAAVLVTKIARLLPAPDPPTATKEGQ